MTGFDVVVLLVLGFSALVGWFRGGARELVTLLAIGGGFLAIGLFGGAVAAGMEGVLGTLLGLVAVFAAADIAVSMAGRLAVHRLLGQRTLRGDQLAGGLFGLVRGWVLAAFLVFTIEVYHSGAALPPSVADSATARPLSATARAFLSKADLTVTRLSEPQFRAMSPAGDEVEG